MKKLFLTIFSCVVCLVPGVASAANHTFTCADLTMNSIATCTSTGDINFFTGGSNQYAYNSGAMSYSNGTTYYVVANVSGSTGSWDLELQQGSGTHLTVGFASGQYTGTIVAGGGGDPVGMVIKPVTVGGVSSSQGTLSSFCISDVSFADCGGGGGGGGGGSNSAPFPFPGKEASTTYQIVDNPTQDVFNGVVLFMGGMVLMLWLFKRRT